MTSSLDAEIVQLLPVDLKLLVLLVTVGAGGGLVSHCGGVFLLLSF